MKVNNRTPQARAKKPKAKSTTLPVVLPTASEVPLKAQPLVLLVTVRPKLLPRIDTTLARRSSVVRSLICRSNPNTRKYLTLENEGKCMTHGMGRESWFGIDTCIITTHLSTLSY